MKLSELAQQIDAKVLAGPCEGEIERVYAGDRIGDLLNHVRARTLLVSNLSGAQLIHLAELLSADGAEKGPSALCLVNVGSHNRAPNEALVAAADKHGIGLITSSSGLFETCGRLFEILNKHLQSCRGDS